jgi:phosphate transport system substrate-binding protein
MSRFRLFPLVLLACTLLCGCKKTKEPDSLLIAGASQLRPRLEHVVKQFVAVNPNARVVCESGGSAAALVALKHGAIDIAMLSRPVAADEDDLYLRDYLIARDGLAIIVNPSNPVSDLSETQLQRIFKGQATKWKDVGGSEGNIVLIDRDKRSSLRQSVEELILDGDTVKTASTIVVSSAEVIAAVKGTPTAIGYITLHKMSPAVKALRVSGVEMTRLTMLSGRYPLSRSFYLAVHLKASPLAERFIAFTRSPQGQATLAEDGLLPVF